MRRSQSDAHAGGLARLRAALAFRRTAEIGERAPLVVPLRGGVAGLVGGSSRRRLVTTIEAGSNLAPDRGLQNWLERRQARSSALLIAPDRATAVALALRWRIDPQRFRLAEPAPSSEEVAKRWADELPQSDAPRPWYAR
ncbi:MAG TPA: hypothetical protein VNI34_09665 [Candidatus Nitrosotalea sp.]|nr:hypothetical protein [Candidatus Nitrosotalea sp.]